MEKRNYICGGEKFAYGRSYILLPISLSGLPRTAIVNGETLHLKSFFHVSLVCAKGISSGDVNVDKKIVDEFCAFTSEHDVSFVRFTGDFYFAVKDEKKTLIALCEVRNIRELFAHLREKLHREISDPPVHVTLYTLQPDVGIGINSDKELEDMTVPVDISPEIKSALGIN